ncbi:MAG: protein kinase [Gemmatimonadales bacterium]|nr:protein kinase [Gemmatimonadales bacterium]MBA3553205.1 protein kinase [Gemmatimonadales bacterium]
MVEVLERLRADLANRYAIDRELGRGGMATVYLATDLKHGRQVALKVLRPDLAQSLGPDRFLQEIRIAAGLTHPNILPLHDSGDADGLLYYVMPYVASETLRGRIDRERQLALDDALRIAREVAEGLAYAHGEGIIHRDVKPENILLPAGHAVIADFGLARAIRAAAGAEVSSGRLVVGTPTYMSPEQSAGAELDARSDLYSLGCVLYEMLAGEPPFTGPSAQTVAAKHLRQPPPPIRMVRPDLPPWVEVLVGRALAKVPAGRFASAAAFADALAQRQTTGPVPMTPLGRRRGWRAAALAGIAAVSAGVYFARDPGAEVEVASSPAGISHLDPTHLAVLYFDTESPDGAMRAVAGGLTEDLIDELGRVEALSVISANGVRPYRDRPVPLDSLARTLSVGTFVGGTVSGPLERPRVTVRLIDAATGLQLDSRVVEPTGGLLAMRRALTQEVARFLRERLGEEISLREFREEAPDGRTWIMIRRADDLRDDAASLYEGGDTVAALRALNAADSLLTLAERMAPGWIAPTVLRGWLAVSRIDLNDDTSPGPGPVRTWAQWGLEHAEHALARKPNDPQALELRGTLRFREWYSLTSQPLGDLESAERDLRAAALPDNPTQARAWSTLSALLVARGSFQEAYVSARRAYESDAFLAEASSVLFRLYQTSFLDGRRDEAVKWCGEGYERFPRNWLFHFCRLTLLWMPGPERPDVDAAWSLAGDLEGLMPPRALAVRAPRWRMMVAGVLARAGLRDSSRRTLQAARAASADDKEMDYYEAGTRLLLGEREPCLALLERYVARDPGARAYLTRDPMFQTLRDDPRYRRLVGSAR